MFHRLTSSALLAAMLSFPVHAADSAMSEQRFDVSIRDQNVRSVFDEISAAIGVPILLSEGVQGRVNASFEGANAIELLDGISDDRGLDWRFDGQRVRVTARSEQTTRIVDLGGVKLKELISALESLDVYNDQFQMTAVDGEFAMIVAPPDYTAVVEVILGALVEREAEKKAARELEEQNRREIALQAEKQRLEFERQERAAALERARWEQRRLWEWQLQQDLRARRGPQINRNGTWGG